MKLFFRSPLACVVTAAALTTGVSAQAQQVTTGEAAVSSSGSGVSVAQSGTYGASTSTTTTTRSSANDSDSYSWLPYTRRGYVGVNLGRPEYRNNCGVGGFSCDDPDLGGKIYTGGLFNDYLGIELAYLNMGRADRGGGRTKAEGGNISLVGRLPLGSAFSLFAKGGATYGRTRVSSSPLSGVGSGKDRGWGGSYGAGLSFDIARNSSIVLEWESHDFHFANQGKEAVKSTTLGYIYRF